MLAILTILELLQMMNAYPLLMTIVKVSQSHHNNQYSTFDMGGGPGTEVTMDPEIYPTIVCVIIHTVIHFIKEITKLYHKLCQQLPSPPQPQRRKSVSSSSPFMNRPFGGPGWAP